MAPTGPWWDSAPRFKDSARVNPASATRMAKAHSRRSVHSGEGPGEAVGLVVDDEIDVALAVQDDALRAVPGDDQEAHVFEQVIQQLGIGGGVFDELESVGAHGVVGCGGHGSVPSDVRVG